MAEAGSGRVTELTDEEMTVRKNKSGDTIAIRVQRGTTWKFSS